MKPPKGGTPNVWPALVKNGSKRHPAPTVIGHFCCARRLHVSNSRYQILPNHVSGFEALLPFIVRIGHGLCRPGDFADPFVIASLARHPAVFVAGQFCELAIDDDDQSIIGQLAAGDADCIPLDQYVRCFF